MNLLVVFSAKYLIYLIILIAVITFISSKSALRKNFAKLSILALPFTYITAKVLSFFIYHNRPFVDQNISPLIKHAADNSFPSDHTLLAMTISSIVFFYDRRTGSILFILSICLGLGRILAKVHYPIDILASTVIAVTASFVASLILNKLGKLNSNLDKFLQTIKL